MGKHISKDDQMRLIQECRNSGCKRYYKSLNIMLRRSRLSGVARATIPDKQSHLVTNYCTMF